MCADVTPRQDDCCELCCGCRYFLQERADLIKHSSAGTRIGAVPWRQGHLSDKGQLPSPWS